MASMRERTRHDVFSRPQMPLGVTNGLIIHFFSTDVYLIVYEIMNVTKFLVRLTISYSDSNSCNKYGVQGINF